MKKAPEAFRTISEVADLLETPAHVLRFWESKFYQIRPVKRAGGRRYYRPDDVSLIAGIRHLLQDRGMTIRGVQKILQEQGVKHVMKLAPPLAAPPPQTGALVEADLPPAIAPDAMPGREQARPADAAGSPPAPVPPAQPQPVVPPPRLETPESPAVGAVPKSRHIPDDERQAAPSLQDAEHESPPADPGAATPAPAAPHHKVTAAEAITPKAPVPPASDPEIPLSEATVPDAAPPDASSKDVPTQETPPAPAMPADLFAARDGAEVPPAPARSPAADPIAPVAGPSGAVPAPQPEAGDTLPRIPAEDRLAQRLRHLPAGALDRRAGQLALIARRLDTLLDRMSEASGAGRW